MTLHVHGGFTCRSGAVSLAEDDAGEFFVQQRRKVIRLRPDDALELANLLLHGLTQRRRTQPAVATGTDGATHIPKRERRRWPHVPKIIVTQTMNAAAKGRITQGIAEEMLDVAEQLAATADMRVDE